MAEKVCRCNCKSLEDFDLFAKNPELYLKGKPQKSTTIGIIFTIISIALSFLFYHTISFIIGFNDLTIEQKALLRRKVTLFNRGEKKKIKFNFDKERDEEGALMNNYKILITTKEGDEENYNVSTSWESFTIEEIEFFNAFINNHIKKNMS